MNTLVQVLEFASAASLILALYMVEKNYKWWLFYTASSILFTVVNVYKGLLWYAIMGVILGFNGIRNYFIGKRKAKKDYHETK